MEYKKTQPNVRELDSRRLGSKYSSNLLHSSNLSKQAWNDADPILDMLIESVQF